MISKRTGDRLIKKYPNRRLYDTQASSYVTLHDVKTLVLENRAFKVVDAKTHEDLTRSILLQIILDEESGGMPMFSSAMLSQIIRFYGNAMQGMMGSYLESTIQQFIELQRTFAEKGMQAMSGPEQRDDVAAEAETETEHDGMAGADEPPEAEANEGNAANDAPNVVPEVAAVPNWASAWAAYYPGSTAMKNAMEQYVEQSRELMDQMKKRMAAGSSGGMPGFPGFPGFPGAGASVSPDVADRSARENDASDASVLPEAAPAASKKDKSTR